MFRSSFHLAKEYSPPRTIFVISFELSKNCTKFVRNIFFFCGVHPVQYYSAVGGGIRTCVAAETATEKRLNFQFSIG